MTKDELFEKRLAKIKPYYPVPYRPGNEVIKTYVEEFTDPMGNVADITKVDFMQKGKKGKSTLIQGHTLYVKWRLL